MRASASANQRKTGKIVPAISARMFLGHAHTRAVNRSVEQHHKVSPRRTVPNPGGGVRNHAVDGCGPSDRMAACRPSPHRTCAPIGCRVDASPAGAAMWSPPRAGLLLSERIRPDIQRTAGPSVCERSTSSLFLFEFLTWRIYVRPMASLLCALHHGNRRQIRPKTGRDETILREPRNHPETDGA